MKADRDLQLAPGRRFKRRVFYAWLTFMIVGVLTGIYVNETYFFPVAMLGVWLPIMLWKNQAVMDMDKPMRGMGMMKRQRERGRRRASALKNQFD